MNRRYKAYALLLACALAVSITIVTTNLASAHAVAGTGDDYPVLSDEAVKSLDNQDAYELGSYDPKRPSWVRANGRRTNTNVGAQDVLNETTAIADAAKAVGLSVSTPVVAASLTTLTTPEQGIEQQADPSLGSSILPDFQNASCWAIEFSDVVVPAASTYEDYPGTQNTFTTKFVVFIDAYSGDLFAGTNLVPSVN